ncbi:hypothetical protein FAGKG844_750006 [Frankia sp. AgKG'84/4]
MRAQLYRDVSIYFSSLRRYVDVHLRAATISRVLCSSICR